MKNLELWDKVRSVPENAQKPIQGGRLKGKTDINPMWRIKALTDNFGPCGIGWKFAVANKWTEKGFGDEVAAFVDIDLYVKHDGEWSDSIPGTGGSMLVAREKNGPYTSDECYKMALTDAISVACKALGFGADIYWSADRSKYDKPIQTQEKPKQTPVKIPEAAHKSKLAELMNLAVVIHGESSAIECIKKYLSLGNYNHTSKIPETKFKDFEQFIKNYEFPDALQDTSLPEDI